MPRSRGRSNLEVSLAIETGKPQAVRRSPKMCDEYALIRSAKPEVKKRIIGRLGR